jgi:hypothetical protein
MYLPVKLQTTKSLAELLEFFKIDKSGLENHYKKLYIISNRINWGCFI